MSPPARDYTPLLDRLRPGQSPDEAMRAVVDGLWDHFGQSALPADSATISWVGFYLWSSAAPNELTLGYRRDKPACSPIGLHGACGRCFRSRRPLVVTDVSRLGAGYIACDPRDRSEVVVPCLNPDGSAWAVLDLDSYAAGAFDVFDALALVRLIRHAGLGSLVCDDLDQIDIA